MTARRSKQPQRSCVACRKVDDQDRLIRFVLAPDGDVLVDYRHKLPGRGAYSCLNRECLTGTVERRQLQRSFRGRGTVPAVDEMMVSLQKQIVTRIENLLGMARKSGQVESGSNAVLTSLRRRGGVALLIVCEDISQRIEEKLMAAAARQDVPVYKVLTKSRLGLLLGKGERSVAALAAGALADAIAVELQRFTEIVREN